MSNDCSKKFSGTDLCQLRVDIELPADEWSEALLRASHKHLTISQYVARLIENDLRSHSRDAYQCRRRAGVKRNIL
jgi:hypothetical protein